ncbi:Glyoxylate/hydroxypyruvate reductase B [Pigmentiphaga humi]|uniref:Glyoxylate/hydroxypyruvate reductase B n=1 Tax=Pigmentiphaga humi TaxID=2478468 RepID=A0A3P4AWB3_9BURK|nr:D-2-hydroxyacid dehydrogenase family protein [Pigmentiphaga humi]VCU68327.1 Glyoxylate/hydroxypyruvate reductase B [Pigmentiphaga humi]
MRITILDDYQDAIRKLDCFGLLDGHDVKVYNNTVKGLGQLAVRLRDTETLVLIRERTQITKALLDKLPQLKLISQTGRVGSHIDVAACTERGIAVAQGVGSPIAPAELTWALIMAAMRRIPQYAANLKHGAWQQSGMKASSMPPNFGLGRTLRGRTLGLFGYGKIGKLVAGYGKAFGMNVQVWGRDTTLERARADGLDTAPSKQALFETSDVLCLLLKLTEETRGIITLADLQHMGQESLLVNTSRAELLQSDALVLALNRGRPGLAAIDVFESEPILQGHPLLRMENVICTPHIGFVEADSYNLYFKVAFENIAAWAAGKPANIVNPEVCPPTR